ncbi:gamma carbonic anhydrase family protein [Conexibacter sp. JD483]|uniref:gamma carbonic anhydrase family protein n=1 Tax=unclassified Conexibacter TaxID=2627773 RepID=UPI00271CB44E|nr:MULTISPECIES: gamma carbonic anhydrase family protein [unclassified Conexibacter]MDO8186825.1 gamma carbonic anhydrase family protein [Conexibacter sp. CPCC 205706]MDO8197421.1 gamma carbonic anhydrase family protein [Conexibacter sp. CPCC 205762]MDR9371237.1 gamma carbonic anhydrase family protein [Conexibacter sp. JD483]
MIEALGGRVPRIAPTAWVHPAATVVGDVEIGPDSSVWPGAVLRGDFGAIRIGARTSVQDNAVIHSGPDALTVVGDDCIVAHLAFIEMAIVEDVCLVGVGAHVLPGAILRAGSVAASGAVLAARLEVPGGHRAQGVPARVVPSVHPDRDYVLRGAANYVRMVRRYVDAGIGSQGMDIQPSAC